MLMDTSLKKNSSIDYFIQYITTTAETVRNSVRR